MFAHRRRVCHFFQMLVIALFFLLQSINVAQAKEVIKIGYFHLPPYVFKIEDGSVIGAAVDYWEQYVAPAMGVEVEWVGPMSINRLIKETELGNVDVAVILVKTPEREQVLNYPENGFYHSASGLLFRKDYPIDDVSGIEDMETKHICGVRGGYLPISVLELYINWDRVAGDHWYESCLKKTMSGRVDATFEMTFATLEYASALYGYMDDVKIFWVPGTEMTGYSAFSKMTSVKHWVSYNKINNELIEKKLMVKLLNDFNRAI